MRVLDLKNVSIAKPGSPLSPTSDAAPHRLVDSVSAAVDGGDILSIIGPNGAGKSTLLKAIAGDIAYTGQLKFNGIESDPRLRARQISVLPQLSLLNFPYRVTEVVGLARIPHQTGAKRDHEIIQQALRLMDIDYLAQRLYTELSGGEKQRVQLARVLAQIWDAQDATNGTRLLLLDEPTAALDLGHQQQLMHAIKTFAQQGVAVVMVLHDINLAAHYSDKLLAMLCSQRIAFGSPHDVVQPHIINRLFNMDATVINHPESNSPIVVGW
ncbi:hemin import ATP-binding protein HmuV [Arenicella chitinivorans]|uniref:Hemin import ATP-binding protein HmuV n=1 Tax=Arenicella chitinivorans TaxID=1329800 RepID=A0A918RMT5_9GAMM|nr:heme ABC transporter ATP-binding protein [Arenicella chitinivorans]GHA02456.1 hemin import ATP-binding protein HmuV [Arenicella chitinivorans]